IRRGSAYPARGRPPVRTSALGRTRSEKTVTQCHGGRLESGMDVQLLQDALDVRSDGVSAHGQSRRDLVAGGTLRKKCEDLAFARSECRGLAGLVVVVPARRSSFGLRGHELPIQDTLERAG